MMLPRTLEHPEPAYLAEAKLLSGYRIEQERRRRGQSQQQFGQKIGLSPAWLRLLESGYPKVRLDHYLHCLDFLDVSPLTVFIPSLFLSHGRTFPPHLLWDNLKLLEPVLIEATIGWNMDHLKAGLGKP